MTSHTHAVVCAGEPPVLGIDMSAATDSATAAGCSEFACVSTPVMVSELSMHIASVACGWDTCVAVTGTFSVVF